MSELQEPSTYTIDNKKPEYYKNQSLNNCSTRNRITNKIGNHLVCIKDIVKELDVLESQKDFHFKRCDDLDDIKFFLNSLVDSYNSYKENIANESIELKSMDFESMMKENISIIRKKESEKNCTEF